jgi:DNA (cytosine-5)-methyltransferase 1
MRLANAPTRNTLASASSIRFVDLYAGAGGLSAGLCAAGADPIFAVETNRHAASTYRANHLGVPVLEAEIDGAWHLSAALKASAVSHTWDILAGGPPCQGWSTLGHRGDEDRRRRHNACIDHFVDQVALTLPRAVLMENVRGLAVREGGAHLHAIEQRLRSLNYSVTSQVVRAADYGIPQLRNRLFVVAVRADIEAQYMFPEPSHAPDEWVTVWDAIGDLPPLKSGGRIDTYRPGRPTKLQQFLRNGSPKLEWHEAPDHHPQTLRILAQLRGEGASRASIGSEVKLTSGFHNTYCRLHSDEPAPAVTSSAGRVSSGRNAHPFDDRALTPREAARLQTFKDDFVWTGDRWPVYLQIGNAVPPLLAETVARPLVKLLRAAA